MPLRVACVGGLTLDWLQEEGQPHLRGPYPGGNALYSAVGVQLAGGTAEMIARIGEDYPTSLLNEMEKRGLVTRSLKQVSGNSYAMMLRESGADREVRRLDHSGRKEQLEIVSLDVSNAAFDGVHVCGASFSAQLAILRLCASAHLSTTLDLLWLSGEIEPIERDLSELARYADVFIPSYSDLKRLWPLMPPAEMLLRLQSCGWETVVLRLGDGGSIGRQGDYTIFVPAMAVRVIDTTGAGDAFCGAFNAKWRETRDLSVAMAWGTAAASMVIEDYGGLHALTDLSPRRAHGRAEAALAKIRSVRPT